MKIAIFGMGRSGQSVYKFLTKKTNEEVFVVSQNDPKSWECFDLVKNNLQNCFNQNSASSILSKMDLIVLSPGIPRYASELELALNENVPVISEIEFAFRHSDIPVVGITGTNGKTTTTTMIQNVLEKFDKKAFACGNIGIPYTDILLTDETYDYAIVELSSFQLESIDTFHPHISVIINITKSHMERYESVNDYKNAKLNILKNQDSNDYVISGIDVETAAQVISIKALDSFDYSKSKIIGEHNKFNFFCAYEVCRLLNLAELDKIFQSFIDEFSGVSLRLEYICNFDDLNIYNDGKSTNDAATVAAVDSFLGDESLYLILGGQLRSKEMTLPKSLKDKSIKQIFVFGEAKELLKEKLVEFDIICFDGLDDIFKYVKGSNLKGNLLFSPAFPSFDQYKNYEERGAKFTELMNKLLLR
jgi:UDP-N-acetylmuramoylalanine--D-glutamate ligase